MNDTYSAKGKTYNERKLSFLTPLGAVIVMSSFFLPWISYTVVEMVQNYSGMDLGGISWAVFIAAVIILIAYFMWMPDSKNNSANKKNNISRPIIMISAIAGLIILMFKYLSFEDAGSGIEDAIQTVQYGLILTIVGFILSIIGALISRNADWDKNQNINTPNKMNVKQQNYNSEKKGL